MTNFIEFGKRLLNDEEGATAIEYGLLAALISVAIIAAVGVLGDRVTSTFETVNTKLTTAEAVKR